MVRRIRHGASVGLIVWVVAVSGAAAAQVRLRGRARPSRWRSARKRRPASCRPDARLDGMIRTGQLVVMSRTDDPTLADRTHEYAAQFVGGVPVLGAGVTRQFARGVTVSAFGTLRENLVLDTAPAITAGEAAVHLERQTGARLADGQAPELTVLPLPSGSYVLAYGAALDDGRYHFASAADGRLVHSFDAFRSQSAIGTGVGILGDRKKVSTTFERGRFKTHDQLRPGEIVTLDIGFDEERLDQLAAPGPWNVRRWTSQDIAADADNDWPRHRGGRRPRPHGLDLRLLRPATRLGRRRRPPGPNHRHRQRLRRIQRPRRTSAVRSGGAGRLRLRAVPGSGSTRRRACCTSSPTS